MRIVKQRLREMVPELSVFLGERPLLLPCPHRRLRSVPSLPRRMRSWLHRTTCAPPPCAPPPRAPTHGQPACASEACTSHLHPPALRAADVDDLKEGRGAEYVDRSNVVLIFASSGYFVSVNCTHALAS